MPQLSLLNLSNDTYLLSEILSNLKKIVYMYKTGQLGGQVMPEDARPSCISTKSDENFHFLTLPMALNYQRNSYTLWQSAAKTFLDAETNSVFSPEAVARMEVGCVREKLLKHKLALQPVKHIDTWRRISDAITDLAEGRASNIFSFNNFDVIKIRQFIQNDHKKRFPYLSGAKIFNYWLYVISIYTDVLLTNRSAITIAPDTHIIQASIRLGVVDMTYEEATKNRELISKAWDGVLAGTDILPIDIHTPLWLWSRSGFPILPH